MSRHVEYIIFFVGEIPKHELKIEQAKMGRISSCENKQMEESMHVCAVRFTNKEAGLESWRCAGKLDAEPGLN